jgi:hypothetical protein
MASKDRDQHQPKAERANENEYMKRGKGRKDDVRGSGIYPASSPDAPPDGEVRTVGDFVKHRGPESKRPKPFKRAI